MKTAVTACFALLLLAAPVARAAPMPPDLADLAARLLPAVVSVASNEPVADSTASDGNADPDGGGGAVQQDKADAGTTSTAGSVLPPPKVSEALGAGFVIDPSGYIVTCNHVIDGSSSVTVTFQDGTILPATVVGRDKGADLAVLKVDAGKPLPAVAFGSSGALRVGNPVMAIGNPFGMAGSTSAGIVSALDRNISEGTFDDFIQTDATINRGNSGGPLFNMAGQVIGVNAAIYSPSGGSSGIGFAIPAAMAAPVAESLIAHGSMQRGWLGAATQDVTPEIAKTFGLPNTMGALIGGISPGGPSSGRLAPGDVLVDLAGAAIPNPRALLIRTAEIPAGKTVTAKFWRNGALIQASITIEPPPAQMSDTAPAAPSPVNIDVRSLGLSISPVPVDAGVKVMAVQPGGASAKAGLVADNVIGAVGAEQVATPQDLQDGVQQAIAAHQPAATLLVSGDMPDGSDPGPRWVAVPLKK